MLKAVAFDLDDTLFLERDYVRSGFQAVARLLAEQVDPGRPWFDDLWRGFESGVRGKAFDRVLEAAGAKAGDDLIARLVRCYREHQPAMELPGDVAPALEALGLPPERLGVITDGPVVMQERKFEALHIGRLIGHVIVTDRWGIEFRKPHARAFEEFERLTGCPPRACAYVSDNPAKDFRSPHERGWTTVRVVRPGGLHAAEASVPGEVDHEMPDLGALRAVLLGGGD